MIARVESACLVGMEAARVHVEVSLAKGLPRFSIVGLPDASVREAKDRVVAAIRNTGFDFPSRRVTVNLAPAELRKGGSTFDLPIALGVLMASEVLSPPKWPRSLWLGELALDGSIRPVRGMLALARSLSRQGQTSFVMPLGNLEEVSFLSGLQLFPFLHLREVVAWLHSDGDFQPVHVRSEWKASPVLSEVDFSEIKGQTLAKRALEIAAAGGHHVLMVGTPGTGKTMLAQALPGILPHWSLEEALEATQVHSVAGMLNGIGILPQRPFRSPHHSVSTVGLVGGGDVPAPGEISLAHRGVLFMDELPEFRRDALEALRQPLENGMVHIQRSRGRASFPADFLFISAMNPCPCGFRGHPKKECECSPPQIRKYIGKISGPLLDRIDLQVELPLLKVEELFKEQGGGESSAAIQKRVERARQVQAERYKSLATVGGAPGSTRGSTAAVLAGESRTPACGEPVAGAEARPLTHPRDNAHLRPAEIKRFCAFSSEGQSLLKTAVDRFGLSARAFDRIHRVARTIADLDASESIQVNHVAEAIQFRALDREPRCYY